ncbi:hypothetical protein ACFFX0_08110 [Citricoccus parietis]|uniref:Uncharacterized protein n=1 Tax=Citricoccus parietis TaxID=592307 RepID=A0ABV5FWU1_9MICC
MDARLEQGDRHGGRIGRPHPTALEEQCGIGDIAAQFHLASLNR